VFGVFTLTLTPFLAKAIFPEGMGGGVYITCTCGNSGWVEGYFHVQELEIPGIRGERLI